jgi:protein-tyrosine phosphatase
MAAALLSRHLSDAGVPADVGSAGVLAPGQPAWPEAAAVMAERGIDLTGHRSRRLDAGAVAAADLVLGMAREHLREAVTLDPAAMARAFTLKELVRRGDVRPRGDRELSDWLAALALEREPRDLLGAAKIDDVDDPIGRPTSAFRKTAKLLDELTARLVRITWC